MIVKIMRHVLALAFLGVVLIAVSAQEVDRDRAVFDSFGCYQCHGHSGQGGAAARIAPTLYPLEAFVQFLRRPSNEMPAYSVEALSDAEAEAIYRYVRAVREPPAVSDIPILR
jgi:mono/diheme cytochrome c family protein